MWEVCDATDPSLRNVPRQAGDQIARLGFRRARLVCGGSVWRRTCPAAHFLSGPDHSTFARGTTHRSPIGPAGGPASVAGGTRLAGCQAAGDNDVTPLEGGGFRFTRKWAAADQAGQATVAESFRPTANSIRWEIEITGDGAPWSAPIETWLQWPAPRSPDSGLPGPTADRAEDPVGTTRCFLSRSLTGN